MAIKKSVRLVDETITTCHVVSHQREVNWSGSLNTISEEYRLLVEDSLPDFCDSKMVAFFNAYNGRPLPKHIQEELPLIHWRVGESLEYDDQARHLFNQNDISPFEFIQEIKDYSTSQKIALMFYIRKMFKGSGPVVDGDEE